MADAFQLYVDEQNEWNDTRFREKETDADIRMQYQSYPDVPRNHINRL